MPSFAQGEPAVGSAARRELVEPSISVGLPRAVTSAADRVDQRGPAAGIKMVRLIIGEAASGTCGAKRIRILVNRTRLDLGANLDVNADCRTYHLDLGATARVAMTEVSWRYADKALVAVRLAAPGPAPGPVARNQP